MFKFFTPPFTRNAVKGQYLKAKESIPYEHPDREQFESEYDIIRSVLDHCDKYGIEITPTPAKRRVKMIKKKKVAHAFKVRPKNVFILDPEKTVSFLSKLLKNV